MGNTVIILIEKEMNAWVFIFVIDSSSTNKREIDKVLRFRGEYGRKAET